MEDLGVDEFDDFDSLPIKPRGKPVTSLKSPLNFEANSSPGHADKSAIKGQAIDLNDTTALLAADSKAFQDDDDPEIEFNVKANSENDELGGVIKRRGPVHGGYQLHFDDIENDSNGNETILASAPSTTESILGPDASLNTDFALNASDPATNMRVSGLESTSTDTTTQSSDVQGDAFISPSYQDGVERDSQESPKGVKFNLDSNDQSGDVSQGEDTTGSFGISALQGYSCCKSDALYKFNSL